MKGDGSIADVIERLLNNVEGSSIDDIEEIKRDSVAINLEYHIFDDRANFTNLQGYGITFQELKFGKLVICLLQIPIPSMMGICWIRQRFCMWMIVRCYSC